MEGDALGADAGAGRTPGPAWRERLRARLRPPRRLAFLRPGGWLTAAVLGIGLVALNTGNNLLYLVIGGMLGFIFLSGILSEQALRDIRIERRLPRGIVAGRPAWIGYTVRGGARRAAYLLELRERQAQATAFVPVVGRGEAGEVRAEVVFPHRGVYPLSTLTVATTFPFGFFRKERDFRIAGEAVVWPRTDRPVRAPRLAGGSARQSGACPSALGGGRAEYRGLREFRPGDDPRDVHWRSAARRGEPVVREYERDEAETVWICLDLDAVAGDADAEAAVEVAAALAAGAAGRGERFGLATPDEVVPLGTGAGQLERVLDALARARFRPGAPAVRPQGDPGACVLVSARGSAGPFADRFVAAEPA